MAEKIHFYLTEDQEKQLTPLFKQAHKASKKGEKGIILAQLQSFFSVAGFVPKKYATKIQEIMISVFADIHFSDSMTDNLFCCR